MNQSKQKNQKIIDARPKKRLSYTEYVGDISVNYHEIAEHLIEYLDAEEGVLDVNLIDFFREVGVDLVAEALMQNVNPRVIYNSINSRLGKGILLGLIFEPIKQYFDELHDNEEELEGYE